MSVPDAIVLAAIITATATILVALVPPLIDFIRQRVWPWVRAIVRGMYAQVARVTRWVVRRWDWTLTLFIELIVGVFLGVSLAVSVPPVPVLIFTDDFSDKSGGWPEGEKEYGVFDYTNGHYRLYAAPPSSGNPLTLAQDAGSLEDAIVEVDAKRIGNVPDKGPSGWGIACRIHDNDGSAVPDYYEMNIQDDGYAQILEWKDGEYTELVGGTFSDAIREGSQTNHIRADCVGSKLTLYVNGQQLLETEDAELGSGEVGLLVDYGADKGPGAEVLFDNFQVSTL